MIALLAGVILMHIIHAVLCKYIYEEAEQESTLVKYSRPGSFLSSTLQSCLPRALCGPGWCSGGCGWGSEQQERLQRQRAKVQDAAVSEAATTLAALSERLPHPASSPTAAAPAAPSVVSQDAPTSHSAKMQPERISSGAGASGGLDIGGARVMMKAKSMSAGVTLGPSFEQDAIARTTQKKAKSVITSISCALSHCLSHSPSISTSFIYMSCWLYLVAPLTLLPCLPFPTRSAVCNVAASNDFTPMRVVGDIRSGRRRTRSRY